MVSWKVRCIKVGWVSKRMGRPVKADVWMLDGLMGGWRKRSCVGWVYVWMDEDEGIEKIFE